MNKRILGSLLTLLAIVVLGMAGVAHAQSTTGFIPEPFVTTVAGLANFLQGGQYTNALGSCTTGFTNSLNATAYNIGDGCLPSQVSLYDLTDIATDTYGNIYWSDNGGTGSATFGTAGTTNVSPSIRVLYKGGATAANLIYSANSWNTAFTAVYGSAAAVQTSGVGKVFPVGGGYSSAVASGKGVKCAGSTNPGPSTSYDTQGDGCPATLARITDLHSMTVDKYGNIYIASGQGGSSSVPLARMIYAGGAQPANLITAVNTTSATGVTAAQVGYIYTIGFLGGYTTVGTYGDGGPAASAAIINPSGIAVDSKGNVYVSDGGGPGSEGAFTGGTYSGDKFYYMNLDGNNVREIFGVTNGYNLVGNVTTVAGETACGGDYVDTVGNHGLLTSASVDSTNAPANFKSGGNSTTNTLTTVNSYYPYVGIGVSLTGSVIPYGCPGSSLAESYTNAAVSTSYVLAYYAPYSNYYDGDGGPATSAYINYPGSLVIDANDNLYISEPSSNRIRVVYSGTGTLPSAVYSSSATPSAPVAGYIYTYAGVANGGSTGYGVGSAGTASPSLGTTFPTSNKYTGLPATTALVLATNSSITKNGTAIVWDAIGIDPAGNIYSFEPSNRIVWKIDPSTNIATRWLGGGNYNNYETVGSYCTGTTGPKYVDEYGSGCPSVTSYTNPAGKIVFDPSGNIWMVNPGTNSGGTGTNVIQEYSTYVSNNGTTVVPYSQFPATADGSTTSLYAAFLQTYNPADIATPSAGVTLNATTGIAFGLQGNSSDSEFSLNTTTGANTCSAGGTAITLGNTCALLVNFTPSHPGERSAAITLAGTSTASGPSVNLTSTAPLVGTGTAADLAIDTGTSSKIGSGITPAGVATDLNGNVYVADGSGNLWKGASSGTTLTTPALLTGLTSPAQVAVDNMGNVYVTSGNSVIEANSTGTVLATITGSTLMSTTLSAPKGVAIDPYGNLYVADTGNNRVARVSTEGFIQPLQLMTSGTTALTLSSPTQLAFDTAGDLFILDSGNSRIVEVPNSSNGGSSYASVVTIDSGVTPVGIALDAAGNLYVADSAPAVLVYYPGSAANTPALPGVALISSGLTTPVGLAIDADANIFVADSAATGLIEDRRSLGAANFTKVSSSNVTLNNVGNSALTLTAPIDSLTGTGASAFTVASASSNGCAAASYAAGGSCGFTASFAPTVIGSYVASTSFNSNAANTATLSLSGNITTFAIPPTVTVTPSPANIIVQQALTVTVVVGGTPTPTGTVTLSSGSYTSSAVTLSSGSATITVPAGTLPVGIDVLTATYTPDANSFAKYTSTTGTSSVGVTLLAKPTVTVTPAATSITTLQSLSVSVSVSSYLATPTGTVTLTNGGLYTSPATTLGSSGVITFIIPAGSLSFGANPLTATYTPDATSAPVYNSSTGTSSVTVTAVTTTLTVTPAATTITTLQSLSVTVSASGTPTPTGTVTLTSGSYTSSATTLSSGSATIVIPAGALTGNWPAATDTLTATYSGNSTYSSATGTATVAVAIEPITISGTTVSVPPGGNFANTSTITVTPSNGFTGTVSLSATITSTPANVQNMPLLSFGSTNPVVITGTTPGYATLTVTTVPVESSELEHSTRAGTRLALAGVAMLGCLLFAGFRSKSRARLRALGLLVIMLLAVGGFSACSSTTNSAGTTAGTYTITITGTSGIVSASNTISLEVQ
jgi:sugar lactone lactonase YvrE